MVERYGDFVLYRPPVKGNTLALWAMPVFILLGGAVSVFVAVRKRNRKLAERKEG
jgi:cytochrome c-type biogenesis protein CcmH